MTQTDASPEVTGPDVTSIAFYLPQFHPIAENDEWWGPGFTEWTNVAAGRRRFPGHRQPILPGELGFYDLRLPETRAAQADLARQYGITAFCYWHYWFGGRRILERVVDEVVASGEPDFPFCVAWANPSWVGTWFGAPDEVLVEQRYGGDDDYRAHFDHLLPTLSDPRYLRVDGKPLVFVQSPWEIPDPENFADVWRAEADAAGLPGLHLVGRRFDAHHWSPSDAGFDAAVNTRLQPRTRRLRAEGRRRWDWWLTAMTNRLSFVPAVYLMERWMPYLVDAADATSLAGGTDLDYPCVMPNWDNTPRAHNQGVVFQGATPELFRAQVCAAVQLLDGRQPEQRILFVKSWNEWAEGNHLEPDRRHGRAWLAAFRDGVADACG